MSASPEYTPSSPNKRTAEEAGLDATEVPQTQEPQSQEPQTQESEVTQTQEQPEIAATEEKLIPKLLASMHKVIKSITHTTELACNLEGFMRDDLEAALEETRGMIKLLGGGV